MLNLIKKHNIWLGLGLWLGLCLMLGSALAWSDNDSWKLTFGSNGITLERAVSTIKSNKGGRILSAATYTVNGQQQHHIKILTGGGRVKIIKIDAETGNRIKRRQGNSKNAYPNNRR